MWHKARFRVCTCKKEGERERLGVGARIHLFL